ncbi:MAG: hypothetical protein AB8I08_34695 [Sandaracinaceae bacterium]
MSSKSQKTDKRRALRKKKLGRQQKKQRAQEGTPVFPIDPAKAGPDSAEKR